MYATPYYQPFWVSENDSQNELEHFGIKGMKWGVRKSPAEVKAGREAKLKKYKQKEYDRVSKLHKKATDKYETAAYKRKGKGRSTPSANEAKRKTIKETYEKELQEIKRMKYKDMQSDKQVVGKQWLKSAAGTAVGTVVIASLTGGSMGMIAFQTPRSISNAKTRNRLRRYKERNRS